MGGERGGWRGADPEPRRLSNHCLYWFLRRIPGKPLAFLCKPPKVKICHILSLSLSLPKRKSSLAGRRDDARSLAAEQHVLKGGEGRGSPIKHSAMPLHPAANTLRLFFFLYSCFFTLQKLGSQTWNGTLKTSHDHKSGEAIWFPSTQAMIYASCFQE